MWLLTSILWSKVSSEGEGKSKRLQGNSLCTRDNRLIYAEVCGTYHFTFSAANSLLLETQLPKLFAPQVVGITEHPSFQEKRQEEHYTRTTRASSLIQIML